MIPHRYSRRSMRSWKNLGTTSFQPFTKFQHTFFDYPMGLGLSTDQFGIDTAARNLGGNDPKNDDGGQDDKDIDDLKLHGVG